MLPEIVTLGLGVGAVSVTLAQSRIFKPLRERIPEGWLKELVTCPFCLGHWLALPVVMMLLEWPRTWAHWGGVVVTWAATVGVAALVSGGIGFLYGAHRGEDDE